MPSIKELPPVVVSQIAAGEVVERPASIVKELLENAVDSGATRVDVAIEKGGADLVRVVDNGSGVAAEELPLAVTNHATSKIASAEELFEVGTLGFRGEALASIASVSRFVMRSRQQNADGGAEIRVSGGAADGVTPAGCPVGTTVEVRDLFYNTPVRRKFLRTAQTESGHATEAFARVALAHPGVHFTLSHNGRLLHDLPPCPGGPPCSGGPPSPAAGADADAGWRDRIGALFGDDLAGALIPVASDDRREDGAEVSLSGFVADPSHSRSHTRMQYLLVNGRAIRDRSLQHALTEAYRGLLLTGRKPICFLRLSMPPGLIDVNVHPQKQEVRFAESGPLYSQLLGTLRSRFLSADLRSGAPNAAGGDDDEGAATDQASSLVEWAQRGLSPAGRGGEQRRLDAAERPAAPHAGRATPAFRPFASVGEPLSLHRFTPGEVRGGGRAATSPSPHVAPAAVGDDAAHADPRVDAAHAASRDDVAHADPRVDAEASHAVSDRGVRALQVHNRYLIAETDAGLEVIDQHALHERVLYEQLRERALAGPLEKQKLLVPEPVDLAPAEAAAVLEQSELLGSIGLEVQPFGGDTVLVASFPAMLRRLTPSDTLREVAAQLVEAGKTPEARDLVDELLHTMSCKAAVKYGDPLTDEEIQALLAARSDTENHHHCPHGRHTSLVFTREELDRRFDRV